MSEAREYCIRDSLKTIYNEYDEIDDFIFTTYNYEADFFDEHIVAYLMNFDRKITTLGELIKAEEWIREKHISVYYDKNAVTPGSSCLTIPVFPQNIKGGVFHPKVIVIFGKLKETKKISAHLFVSSCNLSVNGYGRNKEAFACIEINSMQIARSLSEFITSLAGINDDRHKKLLDFLKKIKAKNDDVSFIWSDYSTGPVLLAFLQKQSVENLTVISPYFDNEGPKALLEALPNRKKTVIIPAVYQDKYNIYKKDYEELIKDKNISFAELRNEDENRFVHAKIFQFGKQTYVGSYNFTTAALTGVNTEATLVFNNTDYNFNLLGISENRFLEIDENIYNIDETQLENKNIFVTVNVQWKEGKIYISSENLDTDYKYSLYIDGFDKVLISDLNDNEQIKVYPELEKHLLTHKSFTVYKENDVCYKGLINEFDAADFRSRIGCESLFDSIMEWFPYSGNNSIRDKINSRLISSEDIEVEKVLRISKEETNDIFDNYYLLAKSCENLIKQIQNTQNEAEENITNPEKKLKADKELYHYMVTDPGSIENILNFLEKEESKQKDIVFKWIIIHYLKAAISLFKRDNVLSRENGYALYKEKLTNLTNVILKKENQIDNELLKKNVDKKYLTWIIKEFECRNKHV